MRQLENFAAISDWSKFIRNTPVSRYRDWTQDSYRFLQLISSLRLISNPSDCIIDAKAKNLTCTSSILAGDKGHCLWLGRTSREWWGEDWSDPSTGSFLSFREKHASKKPISSYGCMSNSTKHKVLPLSPPKFTSYHSTVETFLPNFCRGQSW